MASEATSFRVSITGDFDRLADEWLAFEQTAICTPYQRFDWLRLWQTHIGSATGVTPVLCTVRDDENAIVAILPFGVYRRGPFKIAGWLGDKHTNYFMGLFSRRHVLSKVDWMACLKQVAASAGIDTFQFKNQPANWNGTDNPFAGLGGEPSPSQAYSTDLVEDFDAFLESRKPGRWKRQLRNKRKKLAEHGDLRVERQMTCEGAKAALETYFAQKSKRLAEAGIPNPFEHDHVRDFFRAILNEQEDAAPLLEIYTLNQGDDILAVYAGSAFQGRFSTSICSITDDPRQQFSPGEQLLQDMIADRCRRGDAVLDLGIGESRYKSHWCPNSDRLFDLLIPVTAMGYLGAMLAKWRLRTKRSIKQNERIWRTFLTLRSMRGSSRSDKS